MYPYKPKVLPSLSIISSTNNKYCTAADILYIEYTKKIKYTKYNVFLSL